jgi:cbb3-type cytochrome oxidase maturation protein
MTVLYLLLPLAVLSAGVFVGLFIWATRDGQFDDVTTPQIRVLFDDDHQNAEPGSGGPDAPGVEKEHL